MKTENTTNNGYVLIAMCLCLFTLAFNSTAIMNASVAMRNELNLSTTTLSWLINAYLLTTAACVIIAGQCSAKYGRRAMFYGGASLFLLASVIIAMAHTFNILLVGRILQGLGAAFITPGALMALKTNSPSHHNTRAISLWVAAVSLGFALSPTLGGIITDALGWRYLFWINIPLFILAMCAVFINDKSALQPTKKNAHLDVLGVVLLIAGILPFTLGLIGSNQWGWDSYATIALLIAGPLILLVFWQVETHILHPLVHFEDFKKHVYVAGNLAIGSAIFTIMTVLYFVNIYLQTPVLLHFSALKAGIYMLPFSGSLFISATLLATKLSYHIGFRRAICLSLACMSISFAVLSHTNIHTSYAQIFPCLLMLGIGTGIVFAASPRLGISALPDKKVGEASGVISTINYLAGVAAIAVGTVLFHHFGIKTAHTIVSTYYFSNIQTQEVNKILLGDNSALSVLLQSAPAVKSQLIMQALQSGGLASFTSVMIMGAVVTLLSTIICFKLIPRAHGTN